MRLLAVSTLLWIIFSPLESQAGNFTSMDAEIVSAAEAARRNSALFWTGQPLPGDWSAPCPIFVHPTSQAGGGATRFRFENGEVFDWSMTITGSQKSLFSDVIPHEVDHTVRASLVRHPIERWLDEGCATLFESAEVRRALLHRAQQVDPALITEEWLQQMEYPPTPSEIETLYAVGYSLVTYLLTLDEPSTLLEFQRRTTPIADRLLHLYNLRIPQLRQRWADWRSTSIEKHRVLSCRCAQRSKPLLVIWTAKWCGSCQLFHEAWEKDTNFRDQLQAKFHIHILDIDQHRGLAQLHGITHLPTFQTQQQTVVGYESSSKLRLSLGLPALSTEPSETIAEDATSHPESAINSTLESIEVPRHTEPESSDASLADRVSEPVEKRPLEAIHGWLPLGLTLLQWSGVIGGSAATGGLAGIAFAVLPTLIRSWRKRKPVPKLSASNPTDGRSVPLPVPFPRELDEAGQLLEIRQSEGRVAVLDALRGMFLDDEIEKMTATVDAGTSTILERLKNAIDQRVDEVAPLSTRSTVATNVELSNSSL